MINVPEIFGNMVFNDKVMKERLPEDTYNALKKTIEEGKTLDITIADAVANAMKDWAIEKGVTHFTHWFQPLTGITAEKHDSFISPANEGGVIMEFSGKELIKGESDASSFPSGGLRAIFEARGYTAWDPTSYAFIKSGTLCIPTVFCSYGGQSLDKKTPLLRSLEALNKQAMRILRLLGDEKTHSIKTTVGPEQEYFLIRKDDFSKRKDLIYTGRTLFGTKPPKGQEMDDHYFGTIRPRVFAFMKELDEELWKLGVLAKTEHNEAAPAQHELAPIFASANISADHNQLTMEIMKNTAEKHGLMCLLHEKPFAGINGSGKHNNWSISTDGGENLLEPTDSPEANTRFLLFLCAIIKAVDVYQDLLRVTVASAGNDHRLGGGEAPPAIISIFLGDELTEVIDAIEHYSEYEKKDAGKMKFGAKVLPQFAKDNTDRNRTSPFAFTGNKFEFRMVGSSASISDANVALNTITAEILSQFADFLESVDDIEENVQFLIQNVIKHHRRIIFDGNNYSKEWEEEANRRGLLNLKTTAEALPYYIAEKNIELFEKHKIFTREEIYSRYEIYLEDYSKKIRIEALTMIDMYKKDIIPAVSAYIGDLSSSVMAKEAVVASTSDAEKDIIKNLSRLMSKAYKDVNALTKLVAMVDEIADKQKKADFYAEKILPKMSDLRGNVDAMESMMSAEYWPYPTYGEMLFYM